MDSPLYMRASNESDANTQWTPLRAAGQLTGARKAILVALDAAGGRGLTAADLWLTTAQRYDRVSIYRGTEWLVRAGLAVRVTNDERTAVFFTAPPDPSRFAIFECRGCSNLWRIPIATPSPDTNELLEGAIVERQVLRAVGWCGTCATERRS